MKFRTSWIYVEGGMMKSGLKKKNREKEIVCTCEGCNHWNVEFEEKETNVWQQEFHWLQKCFLCQLIFNSDI